MGTNTQSDAESPDTNTRIDATSLAVDQPNDAPTSVTAILVANNGPSKQSCCFDVGSDRTDDLERFASDVATIAQSHCKCATDYTDIETLVYQLPIDHCTFGAHDASAPYSGPYPMALLIRTFIIETINGWDETALHNHLRANPSLRRHLGFKSLPAQSTFWRAWNERFSEGLRDVVQECANSIITAARTCDVSLSERIDTVEVDETQSVDRPEHQLVAEKTNCFSMRRAK